MTLTQGIWSTCKSRAHFKHALGWTCSFFILRRFTPISDESGKTFFVRKSVFSKEVTFALSMKFFEIAEITCK